MAASVSHLPIARPTEAVDGRGIFPLLRDPLITDFRIGDLAVNLVTGYWFGPKTAAGWPANGLVKGAKGWSPQLATVVDGARRVIHLVDWQGGEAGKPPANLYLGSSGLVSDIGDAIDIRGAQGPQALIGSLDAGGDTAGYAKLVALGAAGEDNKAHTLAQLFRPTGKLDFVTVAAAEALAVPASIRTAVVWDQASGLPARTFRRVAAEPGAGGKFRSLDRYMPDGALDSAAGGWWGEQRQTASDTEATAGLSATLLMTPATVGVALGRGGIPVGLLETSRPDDIPGIIRRYGLTPYDGAVDAGHGFEGDDTPAFNVALERLRAGGGGSLIIPPTRSENGRWRLHSAVQLHSLTSPTPFLNVVGLGHKAVIERFGTVGDSFVAGDTSHPVYYVQVKNIYLINQPGKAAGHDFKFTNASICEIGNIVTDHTYSGFWGENLNSFYGRDLVHFNMPGQTTGNGVTIYSDPAGSGRTDIVKFDELTIQAKNAGSGGMLISGRVYGVHADGLYALGCSRGLQLVSGGSNWNDAPQFCYFHKFEVDRATGIGCVIEKAYRTEFHRCDISNTSGAIDEPYPQGDSDTQAMLILTGAIDTKIIGGRIGNCREQAIFDNGRGTTVIGTTLMDMAKGGPHAAIYTGPNADGFLYDGLLIDGYNRAGYAHQIEAAAKNGIIRNTRYQRMVSGYSIGAGVNVTNTGQVETSYGY